MDESSTHEAPETGEREVEVGGALGLGDDGEEGILDNSDDIVAMPEHQHPPQKQGHTQKGRCQVFCRKGVGEFGKYSAVGLVMPVMLLLSLDLQIYNVAVYPISVYYGITTTDAVWILLLRSLMNTTLGLFINVVLQRTSVRVIVLVGVLGMSVAQLLFPWGPFWLVLVFRFIECLFIAFISPLSMSSIRVLAQSTIVREAVGLMTIIRAVATAFAPTIGGILCDTSFGWGLIPLLIGGLGIVAFVVELLCFPNVSIARPPPQLPRQQQQQQQQPSGNAPQKFDVKGALTLSLGFLSLSIVSAVFSSIDWYYSVIIIVFAALMFVLFAVHERHLSTGHIINPRIVHDRRLILGLVCGFCIPMGNKILGVLIPLIFQQVYSLSSTVTGVIQTIMSPLGQIIGGFAVPAICRRMPSHVLLTICLIVSGVLGYAIAISFSGDSWVLVTVLGILYSVSMGFSGITNASSVLVAAPLELGPMVGSVQTLIGSFSGGVGTALAVTVRDALVPVFEDPSNPTGHIGLRMGSLVSGSLIATICIIAAIIASQAKQPHVPDAQRLQENVIVPGVIGGSSSDSDSNSDSNSNSNSKEVVDTSVSLS